LGKQLLYAMAVLSLSAGMILAVITLAAADARAARDAGAFGDGWA
jgi:hypothetical protein